MMNQIVQDCELEVINIPMNLILTKNKYAVDIRIKNTGNVASRFILKFQYPNLKCEISEKPEFDLNVNQVKDLSIKVQPLKSGLQNLTIKIFGLLKKRIKSYVEVPNPEYKPMPTPGVDQYGNPVPAAMPPPNIPKTITKEVVKEEIIENLITIKNIYFNVIDKDSISKEITHFVNIGGDANPIGENIQSHLVAVFFYNPNLYDTVGGQKLQFLRDIFFNLKRIRREPFYYLTFPVDEEYSSEDARIIKDAFNYFIKEQLPSDINNLILFNLSFIPPINNKPSIIIGKDNEGAYEKIYKKLADEFKNNVDIIIDENLFSNGRLYIDLKDITKDMNVMVINVILTTNLIDNKNLIIKFINLFQ
ncbi:MAG: hypothetical protein ACTSRP_06230 [Candidatus Helarchaeota archaeon]